MTKSKITHGRLSARPCCPICRKTLDGFSYVHRPGDAESVLPGPDDFTFCLYCKSLLVFMADLGLRLATLEEIARLKRVRPEMFRIVESFERGEAK